MKDKRNIVYSRVDTALSIMFFCMIALTVVSYFSWYTDNPKIFFISGYVAVGIRVVQYLLRWFVSH